MTTRRPIPGTGLELFPLVLGTGLFGSATPEDEAYAILDAYVQAGGNVLDTASVYASWLPGGTGKSERTLGRWLRDRNLRDAVVLSTKGAHDDNDTGESRMQFDLLENDLAQSLDRLQTDYIDLYWLHRDDPSVPAREILGWLKHFKDQGLIGAVGCSNWTLARIAEANRAATEHALPTFCASQIGWSLARTAPVGPAGMLFMDEATRRFHRDQQFPLFAYSSQANGFFSGKYVAGMRPEDRKPGIRPWVIDRYGSDLNYARLERAQTLGKLLGASANQIALAWLLGQPHPVFPMLGPSSAQQVADSLRALQLSLDVRQLAELEG
ncbi:MAG: aldo/keto reductase [Verrucomicrobia bacterium]|nr:aldo/keto reductase [Verrucomicrobiota bacterium]